MKIITRWTLIGAQLPMLLVGFIGKILYVGLLKGFRAFDIIASWTDEE